MTGTREYCATSSKSGKCPQTLKEHIELMLLLYKRHKDRIINYVATDYLDIKKTIQARNR